MLQFRCRCRQKISVPDSYTGKKVRCPGCSRAIPVPQGTSEGTYWVTPSGADKPSGRKRSAPGWMDALRASQESVIISALIVGFGVLWLLSELNLMPPAPWIWTLGLAGAGVLTLILGGINKLTMVVGPYLMICAVFSVLRHTGQITPRVEIPVLVIVFGLWMFVIILLGHGLPDLVNDD